MKRSSFGIANNGLFFAEKLPELEKISSLKVLLCEVQVNKQNPEYPITTSLPSEQYADKD
jgi:pyrimidine operon attenuation protein/uracil phosphoribosyltransferase